MPRYDGFTVAAIALAMSAAGCAKVEQGATTVTGHAVALTAAPTWSELRVQVDLDLRASAALRGPQLRESQLRHAKLVTALLDAFQTEMITADMTCDARLLALADSVRHDVDLIGTTRNFERASPAQIDRLRRLITAQALMLVT